LSCIFIEDTKTGLSDDQIKNCLIDSIKNRSFNKVLLIPPDITRRNSGAGKIVSLYYDLLITSHVDILPALGTHTPMTRSEQILFFGDNIPEERFLVHDWRSSVTKTIVIPGEFIDRISGGLYKEPMSVELSNYLFDPTYDLILSIGQVVPHEVAGMANYTKNIVIGCGGSDFINKTHMLGAVCGIENIIGKIDNPVRAVFDYVQEMYINKLPVEYVLTVTAGSGDNNIIGLYITKNREGFERAASLSEKYNITTVDSPVDTCIVNLNEPEFRSTWLGNKAIYRTRRAMADGGNLIILAPGIEKFGEDDVINSIIRKYGYSGRDKILKLCQTEPELINNLSAAAHLIHGSTEGRFNVFYATEKLSKTEIENVGFNHISLTKTLKRYNPNDLKPGYNIKNNENIFFIHNPAQGLWIAN